MAHVNKHTNKCQLQLSDTNKNENTKITIRT